MSNEAKQTTPKDILENLVMNSNIGKSETEWWARAEITRLRAEIEMLRTGDTCARQCEGTAYRIEARNLKSENERLKADAERLDWINRQDFDNLYFTIFQDQPNDGMYGVSNGAGWAIGNTLREAIDAAMQKGGA